MSEVEQTEVKKVSKPRTPKPTFILAKITDANGKPLKGATLEVTAVTKDEGVVMRQVLEHRTDETFQVFTVQP